MEKQKILFNPETLQLAVLQIDAFIKKGNFSNMVVFDHIGFQCETQDEYDVVKNEIIGTDADWHEKPFSGRIIGYVELPKRLSFQTIAGHIRYLELKAPKPKIVSRPVLGFDHCEVFPTESQSVLGLVMHSAASRLKVVVERRPYHTTWNVSVPEWDSKFEFKISEGPLIQKIRHEIAYAHA